MIINTRLSEKDCHHHHHHHEVHCQYTVSSNLLIIVPVVLLSFGVGTNAVREVYVRLLEDVRLPGIAADHGRLRRATVRMGLQIVGLVGDLHPRDSTDVAGLGRSYASI